MKSSRCRVCDVRLVDVLRPDGCQSYDAPVGCPGPEGNASMGHVHYNFEQRWDQIYPKKAEDDGPRLEPGHEELRRESAARPV